MLTICKEFHGFSADKLAIIQIPANYHSMFRSIKKPPSLSSSLRKERRGHNYNCSVVEVFPDPLGPATIQSVGRFSFITNHYLDSFDLYIFSFSLTSCILRFSSISALSELSRAAIATCSIISFLS